MQLTVIPCRPNCTASVFVMCTKAVLRAPPLRLPALRALAPEILMIRPQPSFFIKGMTAREQRKAPTYFTLKSCRRSSSTTVSMGPIALAEPPGADPLLTRICTAPSCSATWATMRSTCSLLVTSATSGRMRRLVSPPSWLAVASRSVLFRATIATSTPSRANSRAMDLPIPRLPPVTMARLPCNPRSMAVSHPCRAPVFRSNHYALLSHQDQGASATPVGEIAGATYRDGQDRRLATLAALTGGPVHE